MSGSKKAIKKLQELINSHYFDATSVTRGEFSDTVSEIEQKINEVISEGAKFRTENEFNQMDARIEALIQDCISSITEKRWGDMSPAILQLQKMVDYYALSMDEGRSGLLLQRQLSRDAASLKKMKEGIQKELDLLRHSKQIIEDLERNNNESRSIVNNIKTNMLDAERLIEEAKSQAIVIKEVFTSAVDAKEQEESFIKELEGLNQQSSEMIERIKGIFGDVNRDSMASSFKQRRDGLMWGIAFNNIINYLALLSMAALSLYLFFKPIISESQVVDIKFIYERLLIIIPLGFISWFASRRSQYLFQLREDYAYKYASAMAFEGYKRQAESNEEMSDELLKIAITNLGRTPTSIFDRDLKHAPTDKIIDTAKEVIPKIK